MQKVPIKIWPNLQNPLALYLAFSTKLQEALCGFLSPAKFHATKATLGKNLFISHYQDARGNKNSKLINPRASNSLTMPGPEKKATKGKYFLYIMPAPHAAESKQCRTRLGSAK